MPSDLILKCCKALADHNLSITFAESATAGALCVSFSLAPESGKILKGGIICYDAGLKEYLLHIPPGIIKKYTPESAEVTEQLARRLKKLITADIYVAVTGLTTSGGSETPEKPVGTMFIHIVWGDKSLGIREVCQGDAQEIIGQTIDRVAGALIELIREAEMSKPKMKSTLT